MGRSSSNDLPATTVVVSAKRAHVLAGNKIQRRNTRTALRQLAMYTEYVERCGDWEGTHAPPHRPADYPAAPAQKAGYVIAQAY